MPAGDTVNRSLILSKQVNAPAGGWIHKGVETHLDFTNGEPLQPWTEGLVVPTNYGFGDALTAPITKNAQPAGDPSTEREFTFPKI